MRGLKAPPRRRRGAGRLHRLRGLEDLLPRLDRARTGHDHEAPAAQRDAAHVDDGVLLLDLAGHQLEGLRDPEAPRPRPAGVVNIVGSTAPVLPVTPMATPLRARGWGAA